MLMRLSVQLLMLGLYNHYGKVESFEASWLSIETGICFDLMLMWC